MDFKPIQLINISISINCVNEVLSQPNKHFTTIPHVYKIYSHNSIVNIFKNISKMRQKLWYLFLHKFWNISSATSIFFIFNRRIILPFLWKQLIWYLIYFLWSLNIRQQIYWIQSVDYNICCILHSLFLNQRKLIFHIQRMKWRHQYLLSPTANWDCT